MRYQSIKIILIFIWLFGCQRFALDSGDKVFIESIDANEFKNTSILFRGQNTNKGLLYSVSLSTDSLALENQYVCFKSNQGVITITHSVQTKDSVDENNREIIVELIFILEKIDAWGYSVDSCGNQFVFPEGFRDAQAMYIGQGQCAPSSNKWVQISPGDENWFFKK